MKQTLTWHLCCVSPDGTRSEFFPATVPGNAQCDYAKAFGLPDYKFGDNYKAYEFLEDCRWIYRAELPGTAGVLDCGGVDYAYTVRLDGREVYRYEGMFRPFRLKIPARTASVEIEVDPVPKRAGAPKGRWQADNVCKPPVSYGWDWHPRLIPSGIWQETFFVTGREIFDPVVRYRLNESFDRAEVEVSCATEHTSFLLKDREGKCVFSGEIPDGEKLRFAFCPNLWWCNGQGEPYLYDAVFQSPGCEDVVKKVGFRRVQLLPQESNWMIDRFPFTQALPPVTVTLNGRQIFAKGSNWVNPEIFVGTITRETYRPLVELAKEAHFNLFRCWGGAIVNKESFFELCDEAGILVWQEFPLACNCYKDDEHYLSVLDSESRAIIERVSQHPCLAIWCGGNELYTGGSSMTEQFHALRLLNANCYRLDPDTPFLYTSPEMGMRHGHYLFRYPDGEECFHGFARTQATAFTEFGVPAPSERAYLQTFLPEEELKIPEGSEPGWIAHHGLLAWEKTSWLHLETIEFYFGRCRDLDDMILKGQILQIVGYKGMFEEARRKKPHCNMALNWCYNEPWPTAANNSLVNYPAIPKKSFAEVARSLAPVTASARFAKFSWEEGELFEAELFLLNDSYEKEPKGTICVFLRMNGDRWPVLEWQYPEPEPNRNLPGPTVRFPLPHARSGLMRLQLERNGRLENEYPLMYYNAETVRLRREAAAREKPMDFVGIADSPKAGMAEMDGIPIKKVN